MILRPTPNRECHVLLSGRVFEIRQSFRTGFSDPPTHLNPFAEWFAFRSALLKNLFWHRDLKPCPLLKTNHRTENWTTP